MSAFWASLRAEIWALLQRRNFRWSLLIILLAVLLRALWAWLSLGITEGGLNDLSASHHNFWPRFGELASFSLVLVELFVIVIIGGALPREIGLGATRDPLCRGISRSSFVFSRACVAVFLPLILATFAVISSATVAAIFFDAGHVITDPVQLDPDPEGEASFAKWLDENGLRADEVAAAMDVDPDYLIPDEYYSFVPILIAHENEISQGIITALKQAVLPLLILGLFAFALSLLMATGSLASGLSLGIVVLFGVMLAPDLEEGAWWFFGNWLPGMGHDSTLRMATYLADGFSDQPPLPARALARALQGNLIALVVLLFSSRALFMRKKL